MSNEKIDENNPNYRALVEIQEQGGHVNHATAVSLGARGASLYVLVRYGYLKMTNRGYEITDDGRKIVNRQ